MLATILSPSDRLLIFCVVFDIISVGKKSTVPDIKQINKIH